MKEFTLEELAEFDGKDGRPAYVAYEGGVYDVTESAMWGDGDHEGAHEAGRNLTEEH
jgi:predicted heme/steroid binding protein